MQDDPGGSCFSPAESEVLRRDRRVAQGREALRKRQVRKSEAPKGGAPCRLRSGARQQACPRATGKTSRRVDRARAPRHAQLTEG